MKTLRVAAAGVLLLSACATTPGMVALRPDGSPGPEPCPKEALKAMEMLRLHPGDYAWIELDPEHFWTTNITVKEGPIESVLRDPIGYVLEAKTRLYGKAWTSGPNVVIRYYEARPSDKGPPVPICAVARLSYDELKKKPGPAPGSAVVQYSSAGIEFVDSFR